VGHSVGLVGTPPPRSGPRPPPRPSPPAGTTRSGRPSSSGVRCAAGSVPFVYGTRRPPSPNPRAPVGDVGRRCVPTARVPHHRSACPAIRWVTRVVSVAPRAPLEGTSPWIECPGPGPGISPPSPNAFLMPLEYGGGGHGIPPYQLRGLSWSHRYHAFAYPMDSAAPPPPAGPPPDGVAPAGPGPPDGQLAPAAPRGLAPAARGGRPPRPALPLRPGRRGRRMRRPQVSWPPRLIGSSPPPPGGEAQGGGAAHPPPRIRRGWPDHPSALPSEPWGGGDPDPNRCQKGKRAKVNAKCERWRDQGRQNISSDRRRRRGKGATMYPRGARDRG